MSEIESLMHEHRIFNPPAEFVKNAAISGMEAYQALGETHIPAIVVDANEVERLLRSVIENIARRQHRPLELLQDIGILRD